MSTNTYITDPKFIKSLNIKVFPNTLRNTFDPSSRLSTEYNLCSIINRLVDQESFIITQNIADNIFQFNIKGYIISIKNPLVDQPAFNLIREAVNTDQTFSPGTKIYAHIRVKHDYSPIINASSVSYVSAQEQTWAQFQGLDLKGDNTYNTDLTSVDPANVVYSGVCFTTSSLAPEYTNETIPDSGDHYCLPLFEYNGSNWEIYPDSQIKFKTGREKVGTNGTTNIYKYHRSVKIDDGVL